MLSAHDSTVSSSALASRAQRVPLPLPSAPRAPAQGGRREAAPEWADHALRATRAELQHGLMQPQAQVSPKYLYDARGCDLFEQITRLPEYYPTRTEAAILADSGAAMAEALRGSEVLIDLVIADCDKYDMVMAFTRLRLFHH